MAQADIPKLPYIPLFVDDFIGGTMHLSPPAVGCYIRLLFVQWKHGRFTWAQARNAVPLLDDHWPEINDKFLTDGDAFWNKRLAEEREKAIEIQTKRSAGGKMTAKLLKSRSADSTAQCSAECSAPSTAQCISYLIPHTSEHTAQNPQDEAAARLLAPTRDAKPPRSKPKDAIRWSPSESWVGISDADRQAWATAYPACDIGRQLAAMEQWLLANPAKAKKSAWRRFVTTWMGRSQDRGGDARSNRAAKPAQKVESW